MKALQNNTNDWGNWVEPGILLTEEPPGAVVGSFADYPGVVTEVKLALTVEFSSDCPRTGLQLADLKDTARDNQSNAR